MKAAYDNPYLHFLLGVALYQHIWGGVQGWMVKKNKHRTLTQETAVHVRCELTSDLLYVCTFVTEVK